MCGAQLPVPHHERLRVGMQADVELATKLCTMCGYTLAAWCPENPSAEDMEHAIVQLGQLQVGGFA